MGGQYTAADLAGDSPQQQGQFSAADLAQAPTTNTQPAPVRFGQNLASGAGVTSTEGAKQFFTHPLDALKAMAQQQGELGIRAKNELANKDYVRGLTHAVEYLMPGLGPNLAQAGNQLQSGDIAGGVGRTLGAAIPIVAGSPEVRGALNPVPAVQRAALLGRTPQAAYESALKPSTTIDAADRANMVSTGLSEKIPVSKAGLETLTDKIDALNQAIKGKIDSGTRQGVTVDPQQVATRTAATQARFANQVNPTADLAAIDASKQEFLQNNPNPIPANQAQSMKQGTYGVLRGKFGEQGSAAVEAQKALARGLKEELAQQFPEIQGLNAKESQLLDLQPVLERAVNRIGNHQLVGIGSPVTAGAVKAVTGSGKLAAVAGVMKAVLDDPIVKSRLAISLSKSANTTLPQAYSKLAAYTAALGQASNASNQGTN